MHLAQSTLWHFGKRLSPNQNGIILHSTELLITSKMMRQELKNQRYSVINNTQFIHAMQILSSPSIPRCLEYLIHAKSYTDPTKIKQSGRVRSVHIINKTIVVFYCSFPVPSILCSRPWRRWGPVTVCAQDLSVLRHQSLPTLPSHCCNLEPTFDKLNNLLVNSPACTGTHLSC